MGRSRLWPMMSAAVIFGLGGCGEAPRVAVSPAAASSEVSSGSAFYDRLAPGESVELPREPASLVDAAKRSTVVVLAGVKDVRVGRAIGDLQMIVVRLNVEKVVHGSSPGELNGVVDVELPGVFAPGDVNSLVDGLRRDAPKDAAVWFLRWQGEAPAEAKPGGPAVDPTADPRLYSLVHWNAGIFVQGAGGVESAVKQRSGDQTEEAPSARREAEGLKNLEELVARLS